MSRTAIYTAVVGLFMAVAACTSIKAADLGGKPAAAPAAVAPAPVPDQWTAPFVEFGIGGQFAKGGEKNMVATVGIGYTYHALGNPWVPGVFARYGASIEGRDDSAVLRFDQPITAGVTLGYLVFPSTRVYGIAGYSKSIDTDFQGALVGLGISFPVFGQLRFGAEYTAQFDKFKADSDVVNEVRVMTAIPF